MLRRDIKELTRGEPTQSVPAYVNILFDIIQVLSVAEPKRCPVAIFENVLDDGLFTLAQKAFDPNNKSLASHPLVIFTTNNEAHSQTFDKLQHKDGLPPIALRTLSGQDAYDFIIQRWQQLKDEEASPFPEQMEEEASPFPEQMVIDLFDDAQWSFKRVVNALQYIMDWKLGTLQPGGNWPEDENLAIQEIELAKVLFKFELQHPK